MVMHTPINVVPSLIGSLAAITLGLSLTKVAFPKAVSSRVAKLAALALSASVLALHAKWHFSDDWHERARAGAIASMILIPMAFGVLGLIPATVIRWLQRRKRSASAGAMTREEPLALTRRSIITASAAALPLAGVGTGASGFVSGMSATRVRPIEFRFPQLPVDLEGLTILHLTDLHLGCTKTVRDVERTFDAFASSPPDLILFTGDIAEDVSQTRPLMKLARQLRPRLGVFAILGNHEYHRIHEARPQLMKSEADLLIDEGRMLRVGGTRLYIGGVDDPISMTRNLEPFFPSHLGRTFARGGDADFRLLLSHRPEAFRLAEQYAIDLTLAGHTHGGQIGFNGKSAFEPLFEEEQYLWGHFRKGQRQLYTSSGYGDWFPFRLGCPAEAPLITLKRG